MWTAEWRAAIATIGCMAMTGCASEGPKTFPVRGKVELPDGNIALLTCSHIEFKHESDALLRPSGKIGPDGSFTVQTLHQGKILPGAPQGQYKARVILGDESDEGVPKRKGNPIHQRFLNFETSGLSFTVPSSDLTVSLSRK
jgi:hypothetical protein